MNKMLIETRSSSRRITEAVIEWPGVTPELAGHGKLAFKVGKKELGHLHGDTAAHFNFNESNWTELMAAERIFENPFYPGRIGPAARPILDDEDVLEVIALMRINYDAWLAERQAKSG